MTEQPGAIRLSTVGTALFAGVLGSVLTLAATGNLTLGDATPAAAIESVDLSPGEITAAAGFEAGSEAPESGAVPVEATVTPASGDGVGSWQQAMDEAEAERAQLAASVLSLTRQISVLEADVINLAALSALDGADANLAELRDNRQGFGEAGTARGRRNGELSDQSVDKLIAAGLDAQSARELQTRNDQYQLARLELFDQAAREGWSDSDQFADRLAELEDSRVNLRDELGDTAYDRFLYESGRPNRIAIASIISGSSADLAGLRVEDLLSAYAGSRLFQVSDLQAATREGVRGEYVQLEIERGGQAMNVQIPRGPLGVTLQATRVQP